MDASTILEQAGQRATTATAHAHTVKANVIDAMRREIGSPYYEQAKGTLREIEGAVRLTYRPFLAQVAALAAKSPTPLPAQVLGWLKEMAETCDQAANQIRRGIDGWDQLTPPIWKDGKHLDEAVKQARIFSIRQDLRSGDGKLRGLHERQAWISAHIQQSGWPAA
ncbi:MAG: hypothetical protein ACYDGR_16555 [Candidatus Dormibacteria bacterium]